MSYANLEVAVAARRLAEKPVYDKEARLLIRHARFDKIGEEHNAAFILIAEKANLGEATQAKKFLFSENAVLKELNDKVVGDKDLVTAFTNLRKDLEHFHLQQDPELAPHVVVQYSDFKVHQLGLDTKDPIIVAKASRALEKINRRFSEHLLDLAKKKGWAENGTGLAKDPKTWFHAGRGQSPDEAALAARDSRLNLGVDGAPVVRSFAETRESLVAAGRKAALYQKWVAKRFATQPGFLTDAGAGKSVLSAEVIEAMKKAVPKAPTAAGYREAVQDVIKRRFGLALSDREADALKNYLALADRFSPPLLLAERVVIDMAQKSVGVVSADFKGQNARNLEETLKALARSEGRDLGSRVKEVRKGEQAATASLELKKARFRAVLKKVVPGLEAQFSGDDGMGFLQKAFTEKDKIAFANEWAKAGGGPEDLRLTFEDFHFADTKALMPAEARSRFVVEAEGIEKKLRGELIGGLSREELNGMQILVSLDGFEKGSHSANIVLISKAPIAGAEARARAVIVRMGYKIGSIRQEAL